jgi:hypothetical protein
MLVRNCKPDSSRLGVLAECTTGCDFRGTGGEWPGHFLSTRTVAYSCGILAREGEAVVHAHDRDELKRCRRLAAEAAAIMQGVYIGWADESDHLLGPFSIPANAGDTAPRRITEKVFRAALRGTVFPDAILTIEPFKKTSDWWKRVSALHPDLQEDPGEHERVAKWGRLFDWFRGHEELRAPAYVGFEEPKEAFTAVYPKFFLALTAAGSLVGLVTCVVWT